MGFLLGVTIRRRRRREVLTERGLNVLWGTLTVLWWGLLVFLFWQLSGCGTGGVGEACRVNADCDPGLACFIDVCGPRAPAATDAGEPELAAPNDPLPNSGPQAQAPGTDAGTDAAIVPGTDSASADVGTDAWMPLPGTDAAPPPPACEAPAIAACLVWCSEPCTSACAGWPYAAPACGPVEPSGYWCCE